MALVIDPYQLVALVVAVAPSGHGGQFGANSFEFSRRLTCPINLPCGSYRLWVWASDFAAGVVFGLLPRALHSCFSTKVPGCIILVGLHAGIEPGFFDRRSARS